MSNWPAIQDIALGVQTGDVKAVDLVKRALKLAQENSEYNSLISTISERAKARALAIDKQVQKKEDPGPLAGVPFIAKDNFLTFGCSTTAGSKYLKDFKAPYQATAIERLEAAGAICVGKSNLDAWAHGSSTENSDFFVTKNPHDKNSVAGGSSGGSAAAVSLDITPFALGTDTGGSVRLPASFCGTVGLKPTYGLISRSGIVAMVSSTDVVGVLARDIEDTAQVLDVLAGKDQLDSTTISRDPKGYGISGDLKLSDVRVGIIKEYMSEGLEPGVSSAIENAIESLKRSGMKATEASLPSVPLALAVYYIICPAEVSSNLARYDGQRYGYWSKDAHTIEESYFLSREEGFGTEAKRRIMVGSYVLSSGYYDAYYKKAQTVRTKIINEFNDAFEKFDFLIGPTCPTTAFKIGERSKDPLQMYLTDIMTVAANITGVPAINLPIGLSNGMPVGLQIMGAQKNDRNLLLFAKVLESVLRQ